MKNIKWHILFWSIYFVLAYTNDRMIDPDATFFKEVIFFTTQNLYLFYGLLYVLRTFSANTRIEISISLLRFAGIISVFVATRYYVRYCFLAVYFEKEYGDLPISAWISTCLMWIINYFIYAAAYFYFQTSIQKQKALLKSQERQLTHEKEKVQLENIALRAQINPHFLYNTLDFLYAQALPLNERLSDGIVLLADMMRYSIRPQDAQGMVNLGEEIEHLENVIEIHRLRFGHSLHIHFIPPGQHTSNLRIIPLVLITLVENVLKYGDLHDPQHPATIRLELNASTLQMTTNNRKRTGPRELTTGIGLDNTRKRLAAVYGNHFMLGTRDDASGFHTTLSIPLTFTT